MPDPAKDAMARAALDDPLALLTIPQVAWFLQVTPRHIWNLISEGELRTVKLGGRATRVSRAALAELIARREVRQGEKESAG